MFRVWYKIIGDGINWRFQDFQKEMSRAQFVQENSGTMSEWVYMYGDKLPPTPPNNYTRFTQTSVVPGRK